LPEKKNHVIGLLSGEIAEECFKIEKGQTIMFHFDAEMPVEFNIHYHEGEKVTYPVKRNKVKSMDTKYTPKIEQEYCLMWTNIQKSMIDLEYSFKVKK